MILFTEKMMEAILRGEKTVTRRTWRDCRVKIGGVYQCKFGKDMRKADSWQAKIKVVDVNRETLHDMTELEARKEGFENLEAFKTLWNEINAKKLQSSWDWNVPVWRIEFELVETREGGDE